MRQPGDFITALEKCVRKLNANPVIPLEGTPADNQTIHYRHDQTNRRTFAIICPSRAELVHAANQMRKQREPEVFFQMGTAKVHPKDNYCKAIGRTTALNSLQVVKGKLKRVFMTEVGTSYSVSVPGVQTVYFFRKHGHKCIKLEGVLI